MTHAPFWLGCFQRRLRFGGFASGICMLIFGRVGSRSGDCRRPADRPTAGAAPTRAESRDQCRPVGYFRGSVYHRTAANMGLESATVFILDMPADRSLSTGFFRSGHGVLWIADLFVPLLIEPSLMPHAQ